jgi:RNA polymerase sigma factor (sigma-70 family)
VTEDEVIATYRPRARALAQKISFKWYSKIAAQDLTQVALMAAIKAFRSFQPGRGAQLSSWIIGKMGYAVLDAVRTEFHTRGKTTKTFATEDLEDRKPEKLALETQSEWPRIEAIMDIGTALKRLNLLERDVIDRRFFRDEQLREVGAALGIHFTRVAQIEQVAFAKMRTAFEIRAAA